jgi:hypothetical protein
VERRGVKALVGNLPDTYKKPGKSALGIKVLIFYGNKESVL